MTNSTEEHLALFCPSARGGGAERVIIQLANQFANWGIKTDLILASATGPYLKEISDKVCLIDLKSPRVSRALFGLVKYLSRSSPTALLSTLGEANVVAILARKLARVPTKIFVREASTVNSENYDFKGRVVWYLMKCFYSQADGVIAISKGVRTSLLTNNLATSDMVSVIYNPVIHPEIQHLARKAVGHPWFNYTTPIILAAGRLAVEKDYPTLLRAFAKVAESTKARLIILGEGPERKSLQHLIDSSGLTGRVDLVGFVENPFSFMKRADLFVLSSAWEGLGNVLVQAMALSTRVVATNCPGGPAEILEDGRWGKLVPVGSIDELALAIEESLCLEKGKEYSSECLDRFETIKVTKEYLTLLLPNFEVPTSNESK